VVAEDHVGWAGFLMPKLEPALRAAVAVIGPDDRELNEPDAWTMRAGSQS
jgi:hypothetical protein